TDAQTGPPRLLREARIAAMIAGSWFVPIHGYLFTRAAVEILGGWNATLSSQEDDEYLLRAALASIDFARAPDALVYYGQHVGERRATPGKTGEPALQGLQSRMCADLTIREGVYEQLRITGRVRQYQHAFERWEERLRHRYDPVLRSAQVNSPLLDW